MRKLFVLFFIFLCVALHALPLKTYTLSNGIKVYLSPSSGKGIDVVNVIFEGGLVNLSPETSGLEEALISMMEYGGKDMGYEAYKEFLFNKQTLISGSSSEEGSIFSLKCLHKYFDESLSHFTSSILEPRFDEANYETLMMEYEDSITRSLASPEDMLFYYMRQVLYNGHPYEASSSPTVESINNLTLKTLKEYHKKLMDARCITIVGSYDGKKEDFLKKLEDSFSSIPPYDYLLKDREVPNIDIKGEPCVFINKNAGTTSYILRAFSSPSLFQEDYAYCSLVSKIYNDILFNVVREKYGICYTPSTGVTSSRAGFGYEYLFKVSDLNNFQASLKEARSIMEEGKVITGTNTDGSYILEDLKDHLEGYINSYITAKYSGQGSIGGLLRRYSYGILQTKDPYISQKFTEKVKKATSQDILRIFHKYWSNEDCQYFAVTGPDNEERIKLDQK